MKTNDLSINPPSSSSYWQHIQRYLFGALGGIFLVVAMVGIVLPVLPTTPFLLLTAACWARSSQRFHHWLLNHPLFGASIRDWEAYRIIPKKAKYLAWSMMAISCGMLFYRLSPSYQWLAWLTSFVCLVTAIWMAKLPKADSTMKRNAP